MSDRESNEATLSRHGTREWIVLSNVLFVPSLTCGKIQPFEITKDRQWRERQHDAERFCLPSDCRELKTTPRQTINSKHIIQDCSRLVVQVLQDIYVKSIGSEAVVQRRSANCCRRDVRLDNPVDANVWSEFISWLCSQHQSIHKSQAQNGHFGFETCWRYMVICSRLRAENSLMQKARSAINWRTPEFLFTDQK
jgi:hypothetical protein